MVKYSRLALATSLLALSAVAHAQDLSAVPSGTYTSDPTHSYITFSYNHLGLSNPQLSFDDFDVEMNLDTDDPTRSMVRVTIDPNSVVAGSEIWKEHLTGGDFFDTANHPEITFQSSDIEAAGDGAFKATGDLTIKDQTQSVTLDVALNGAMEHPISGKPTVGLDASGMVMRSDFGVDKFVPNVSDEVQLLISTELVKAE